MKEETTPTAGLQVDDKDVRLLFGLQKEHIDLIESYAKKFGGYNYQVFITVARIVFWEPTTLACYFFEWRQKELANELQRTKDKLFDMFWKSLKDAGYTNEDLNNKPKELMNEAFKDYLEGTSENLYNPIKS